MIVYRVETADGEGPYEQPIVPEAARDNTPQWPGPLTDGLAWRDNERFGFPSRKTAEDWFGPIALEMFPDDRKLLRLSAYDVPDGHYTIGHSGKQLVFLREKSRPIGHIPFEKAFFEPTQWPGEGVTLEEGERK